MSGAGLKLLLGLSINAVVLTGGTGMTASPSPTPVPPNHLAQNSPERVAPGVRLFREGRELSRRNEWRLAIEKYQQALRAFEAAGDGRGQGLMLFLIGRDSAELNEYARALDFLQQAEAVFQRINSVEGRAGALLRIGSVHRTLGNYARSLEAYEQCLKLYQSLGNRTAEGAVLNDMGLVYGSLGESQRSRELLEQALTIRRAVGDRRGEGVTLNNMAIADADAGNNIRALELFQQSLLIRREVKDRAGEAVTLTNLGGLYERLGRYSQAIEVLEQALVIQRERRNRDDEADTLNGLASVYTMLSQYPRSLELLSQALTINRTTGNRKQEGETLLGMADVYYVLGQYDRAIVTYQQALNIFQAIQNRNLEAISLNSMATIYAVQNQYAQARERYEQAIAIRRAIGDRRGEATTLNRMGELLIRQRQYDQALQTLRQALQINQALGNRLDQSYTLNAIGLAYSRLRQYEQALKVYQQGLIIIQKTGNERDRSTALSNIARLMEVQNQPELAIIFYKQSVDITETIRQNLRGLSREQQESFTETVAERYRKLADLLLQQNRVLEAQRVLDLLKVQELEDYLQNVRGNAQTGTGIDYWQPEQQVVALYRRAIAEGEELARLEAKSAAALTPEEQQRYRELLANQSALLASFDDFVNAPVIKAAIAQLRQTTSGQNIELTNLNALRRNLRELGQDAVLLYPLVLPDRLELVLVSPNAPPIRRTVPVNAVTLNAAVVQLGQQLKDPRSDVRSTAQRLYEWLIKPLEADLRAANARTIIFAPDGALRYVPLAALHDGQRWLAQRFAITHITAASLTNFSARPQNQLRVLAAACEQCAFTFSVGDRTFNFRNLPFAETEVRNLSAGIPGSETLINQAFSPANLQPLMRRYPVLHLATHAAFVQGRSDESFIVFGDGTRVTLRDIRRQWSLEQTDLVVLSACETALGESQLGSGIEILGFGYQMQEAGARAAIASLWQVSDGGTQMLMDAFYAALNRGMTKAEALRQAQVALITGDLTGVGGIRGGATISVVSTRTGLPVAVSDRLNHPYYWAPFILIGNGL
jgi:CHAT domain-containing protein/Tfp pilus assembly protein PilF